MVPEPMMWFSGIPKSFKYIGHDVDRIAYDHIFCVRRYSYNLRSNVFKNIYIGLGQLDSC